MRKTILVPALLCGMTVIAGAQTKITGKLTCAKPSVSEAAGDDNSLNLSLPFELHHLTNHTQ